MVQAVITLGQRPSQRMRRRELLLLLGGVMTAAPAVRAQQKAMPVIGLLGGASLVGPFTSFVAAFREGLSENRLCRGAKCVDRIPLG